MQASSSERTALTELPSSLLVDVLSRVSDVIDLVAIASTCSLFRELAATIRWKLCLGDEDRELPFAAAVWHRAAVPVIRKRLPLTRTLDLTRSSIIDDDVAYLLGGLRNLHCLVLDSSQKLTSAVVDALAVCVQSGPCAVSLQRCFRIGPAAAGNLLAAAAADGSRLSCVLLSHLDRIDVPRKWSVASQDDIREKHEAYEDQIRRASVTATGSGLKILALHNCGGLGTFELAAVAATCPLLEILLLGGSVEALELSRVESLCEEKVAVAVRAIAQLVEMLERLRVLELTFFTSSVLQGARLLLPHNRVVELWDLCERQSAAAALFLVQQADEDVAMGVRAAVNCSDIRRRTPLHVAAALGDAEAAESMVGIGARTRGMKDSAGASALFVAAECGSAAVCDVLLRGGADVFAKNRAGENPIYIAALKGHCEAVEVMLSHCARRGWKWQDVALYGDGWTPLMAAAVADRQDVGQAILRAAAAAAEEMMIPLLDARNRHGQTALHIAARRIDSRASLWFVTNLVAAGASTNLPDEFGSRPLDVAVRYRHSAAADILRQWGAATCGAAAGGGRRRCRKSKPWRPLGASPKP